MKTSHDPRHIKRQRLVQELFRRDFHNQPVSQAAEKIVLVQGTLDEAIQKAAPEFPINKINKTDLAILRLATYEFLIEKKTPENVIIDEAVELAKEFGSNTSPSFINGVLGNITTYDRTTNI